MFDHSRWHCQTIRVIYPSLQSLYFSVRHYIKQEICHLEIASTEKDAIKLGISQVVFSVNPYTYIHTYIHTYIYIHTLNEYMESKCSSSTFVLLIKANHKTHIPNSIFFFFSPFSRIKNKNEQTCWLYGITCRRAELG
ncbi:LOW QUALITY PROTEIN: hypothetical protein TorRG33x02_261500 [Trema orientale]|uniref:Uncharacterized protein n=1 Tax=Trema orientale TaxID=63057 RepID=A0A2P5D5T6_TREOI|nr:LOW QUALITY PROTEIN: hypothetical protein TorRG33x02_261500 [Trema orientale]